MLTYGELPPSNPQDTSTWLSSGTTDQVQAPFSEKPHPEEVALVVVWLGDGIAGSRTPG